MGWRAGVDSGGTFTDVCLFNEETGRLASWKTGSTPADPSKGIVEALRQGLQGVGADMSEIACLGHGTTVATNSLIELRGARTGLVTTDGFRDLLEIGRQRRPHLYDMQADKPRTLVSRDMCLEVPERRRVDGSVETPLDLAAVHDAAKKLADKGAASVAVCFLYSFLDGAHERAAADEISRVLDDAFVSLSSEVAPEFREFERLSTTVVNAFLGPLMRDFAQSLEKRLRRAGLRTPVHITQSNGGVAGIETAAEFPVRTLLSGPSTGVVAAQRICRSAGFENVITFDAGGTSSDVALLDGGKCSRSLEAEVHGYPIKFPMLDIHTVGAGGGSIATVDSGGLLKVGPESAGADPGPACYGRGGTAPTVTDANVVLGTLNPEAFLGGKMKVHGQLAIRAVDALAAKLELGRHETAQGIVSVATANMAKAIRVVSVQRGHDPRDHALLAFGGSGPLHAARLARELDIRRIVVPQSPGTLCALGLLMTDLKADFWRSCPMTLSPAVLGEIEGMLVELEEEAFGWFEREAIAIDDRLVGRSADLRYAGQNHELQVPCPAGRVGAATLERLTKAFASAHRKRFGFAVDGERLEIVTLRVEAVGRVPKASLVPEETRSPSKAAKPARWRSVWMPEAGGAVECAVHSRSDLRFGHAIAGPAIVEQMDATTLILPGMTARCDAWRNLVLEWGE
ncbi:MAG: hydantoinase/oxoprolinase family protein [Rhodobacteraceae bacterium]|nr:hydantoinase/oxoprolinase family protein [Paracoccaceae bacterium]